MPVLSTNGVSKRYRIRQVEYTDKTPSGKIVQKTRYEVCKLTWTGWKVASMPAISFIAGDIKNGKFITYLRVLHTILPIRCEYDDYLSAYQALIFLGYRHKWKGYTVCKVVNFTSPNSDDPGMSEYWYILEGGRVCKDYTDRMLSDNEPDVLNFIQGLRFKSEVIKRKWL